jgi:hypothetical protein
MVDKVLKMEEGLTFDVFKDEEPVEEQPPVEEEENEDGVPKRPKTPEEKFPRHVFIKEVVREPRMHFYKVPRLGSYLAIRLEFASCINEAAFEAAVTDYTDVRARQKEQDIEKKEHLDKLEDDKEEEEGGEVKQETR